MYPAVGLPQGGMIQFLNCLIGQLRASASNIEGAEGVRMARCQVIGVTSSVRKSFGPMLTRARQISLQRPINTGLAVFAMKADARLALLTYARQTRRQSPDTWPLNIDTPNASKSLSFRNQTIEDSSNLPLIWDQGLPGFPRHTQSLNASRRKAGSR